MKIVITGAAGFIGSALANALASENEVIGIDNLRSGYSSRLDDRVMLYQEDLCEISEEKMIEILHGAETLFHLAAEKYNSSKSTPERLLKTNIFATERLFRLAGESGVKSIVFTSSLYAYGYFGPQKMSLEMKTTPNTLYGISKIFGEELLQLYSDKYGFKWHAPRLFFVYGPRQFAEGGYKSVIVKNINSLLEKLEITCIGDGNQKLDYIYVDDVVEALILMQQHDESTFLSNICTGKAISVNDIMNFFLTKNPNTNLKFLERDWTHNTVRVGDPNYLINILNWRAKTEFKDGMEKTWIAETQQ